MGPRMQREFPGFLFDWDRLVIRDDKYWNDLSEMPPDFPVFYDRVPRGKEGRWKQPATPFKVIICISHDYYEEIIDFLETGKLKVRTHLRVFVS